ncbi:uncharacterized protein LOC131023510 [Salvia miltiorrhiza]|uniref:uncharacterized protein LOC131023510 n=1 Tax=Salvia miltiorrhiza TaxID=226208 RepID=UPI0025ACE630|nr:uncharacterized protein LOC131023510 [Salvia miltiorrhiza]
METCNDAGTHEDYLVKQFVRSLKDNAFDCSTFDLLLYYGGQFEEINGGKDGIDCYVGGFAVGRYGLDLDLFGYFDLKDEVDKLGIKNWNGLWYVKLKNSTREEIVDDKGVMSMLSGVSDDYRHVDVFIEGGDISGVSAANREFENVTRECEGRDPDEILIDNNNGEESEGGEDDDYDPVESEGGGDTEVSLGDTNSGDDELNESRKKLKESRKKIREKDSVFSHIDDPEQNFNELEVSGNISEYEESDGYVNTDESEGDAETSKLKSKIKVYDPTCDHKTLEFQLGMRFDNGWVCRDALKTWAIENGKHIRFKRVSADQCEANCKSPCKWRVYGSIIGATKTFKIKTLGKNHTCSRDMNNKLVGSKWIATKYLNIFRLRPNISVEELKADLWERFSTRVGVDRLYKARSLAREMVRGSVDEHYGMLRRYLAELRRVDKDGRYELLVGEENIFKGLYIGISQLIGGFIRGCRPIIGLDGCFLKTYLRGILLVAVGKDGNNQMFSIAWAIVEIENQECWTWFLKLLFFDLGIQDGEGWTFISDQQKGLENAVANLEPNSIHRNCARHIYMNWKKIHKGSTLKSIFWRTVRATTVADFKMALLVMKKESAEAFQDFISRDFHKFCKAYFSTTPKSDALDNNISETFNGFILNARGKHIIHMCEEIRTSIMSRQVKKLELVKDSVEGICPNVRKKLEKLRFESRNCITFPAVGCKFEVQLHADRFVVDVEERVCACRVWQLTGLPCVHGICAIQYMGREVSDFVDDYYSVGKYLEAYEVGVEPINGHLLWPEVEGFTVKPPVVRKMAGRPKLKRKRAAEESDPKNPHKLRRHGQVIRCKNYGMEGHNSKTCGVYGTNT